MQIPGSDSVRRQVRRLRWALILGISALVCTPAVAHHSFATYYVESDTMELEGDVVEFQYKNPHAWIFILTYEPFGASKSYAAEWASPSRLDRDEITRNTLRPGDRVRIWASPNRNPTDNRIRLKRIERPADHWRWGGNPRDTR